MNKIPVLFELMKKNNIKQQQLSKAVGVSQGNISDWKSGRSSPSIEVLPKIAEFFNVTTDYLLGLDDVPNAEEADEYVEYTNSFVACIDILGFSEYIITNARNPVSVKNLFNDMKNFIRDFTQAVSDDSFKKSALNSVTLCIVSDTIVLSVPKKSEDSLELLIFLVNSIAFRILYSYGLLCRGGISEGGFYQSENIAFGPAFIYAHELECRKAVYPRIILQKGLWEKYINMFNKEENSHMIAKDCIDDFFIADYISYSLKNRRIKIYFGGEDKTEYENQYKKVHYYMQNAIVNCTEEKVLKKYKYFVDYYNMSIDNFNSQTNGIPFNVSKITSEFYFKDDYANNNSVHKEVKNIIGTASEVLTKPTNTD